MDVIDLTDEKFIEDCARFAEMIHHLDIIAVVGIKTGGYEVAKNMHHLLQPVVSLYAVEAKRDNTNRKKNLRLGLLTRLLPSRFNNLLRVFEHKLRVRRFDRSKIENRNIVIPEDLKNFLDTKTGTIILIDDAVDTGYSMSAVIHELAIFPNIKIMTGALVQTFDNPVIDVDFKLYYGKLLRFPWSMDIK